MEHISTGELKRAPGEWWTPEIKRAALLTGIATVVMSLVAHGFLFTNEFFSHDSLGYYFSFERGSVSFYVSVGRFGISVYELIKGNVAAPWLMGLLFTLWMALSAFLVVRLLGIRSPLGMALTSALLCSNPAMTLTGATYIYCMDEYAFALFAAVAAVYLFRRGRWWTVAGVAALVVSISVYQAYFTVALGLCVLLVMKRLTDNEKGAFLEGVRYVALLAAGFVVYYGVWTVLCAVLDVEKMRTGESILSNLGQLPAQVVTAAARYMERLLLAKDVLGYFRPALHWVMVLLLGWRLIVFLLDREVRPGDRVLMAVLCLLLPVAFNAPQILFPAAASELTTFSWELPYLLLIMWMEPAARRPSGKACRSAAAVALCGVLWFHTVYANTVYLKKELEKGATISLATRVIERVEQVEGYVPGQTYVALVGRLDLNDFLNRGRPGFEDVEATVGLFRDYSATYALDFYITDYLNYPMLFDKYTDFSQDPQVQAMPVYPDAGAIQMVNGVVVVKISQPQ